MAAGYRVTSTNHTATLIEYWNGSSWSVVPSGSSGGVIKSVSCVSASFCTAAGYESSGTTLATLVESWNGTKWSIVPSPNQVNAANFLTGVSCTSASVCIAAGYYLLPTSPNTNQTLIESWNGTSWSIVPSPNQGTNSVLNGVSCAAGTCMATGAYTSGTSSHTLIESGPASG
jgi:hypothetical protein